MKSERLTQSKPGGRPRIHVGRRSTIVIPAAVRKQLGIEEGDELRASVENGRLVLERVSADPFQRLREAAGDLFKGVDGVAYQRALRDEPDDQEEV